MAIPIVCRKCGARNFFPHFRNVPGWAKPDIKTNCNECGSDLDAQVAQSQKGMRTESEKSPGIVGVLQFLALISVVSGIFCAFYFWPDYGNRLIRETFIMYSIILFVSGIISAVIFVAMSSAIKLLYQIDQRLAQWTGVIRAIETLLDRKSLPDGREAH